MKVKYQSPWLSITIDYDMPEHMTHAAREWVERGRRPGGFLWAVLQNDLMEAFKRADTENTLAMRTWAQWVYDLPMACRNLELWAKEGGILGDKYGYVVVEVTGAIPIKEKK